MLLICNLPNVKQFWENWTSSPGIFLAECTCVSLQTFLSYFPTSMDLKHCVLSMTSDKGKGIPNSQVEILSKLICINVPGVSEKSMV